MGVRGIQVVPSAWSCTPKCTCRPRTSMTLTLLATAKGQASRRRHPTAMLTPAPGTTTVNRSAGGGGGRIPRGAGDPSSPEPGAWPRGQIELRTV